MLSPVLVYGSAPGGQLTTTTDVENFPGFADVIQGPWLMDQMRDQAKAVGTEMIEDHISSVNLKSKPFEAVGDSGQKYTADSIIISTGAQARWLNLESEQKFRGFGVSACATCDGFFYKNKEVAVIGGGDSALEEAVYLSKICSKVYVVHRRDTFRAAPSTIEHMKACENIEEVTNVTVEEVYGDATGVTGLKVKSKESGDIRDLNVPGVFVFVGRDVLNEPLKQEDGSFLCDTNEQGEVIVDLRMKTSVPGLYAAGDVRIDAAKQVVCAAGDGATAAVDIIEYIG
jgi:thioredoxin reductase (NADPH)